MKQTWLCYCLFAQGTTQRVNFPLIYGPRFPRVMQAGVSGLISDLNDLSSRTQEMISRDHKFGGSSKQNSEKCSSSLSAIHSNESVVTLKVITL